MGEPLAIPLFWAAIFSNNGGREKGNKGKLWGQTEVSCRFFLRARLRHAGLQARVGGAQRAFPAQGLELAGFRLRAGMTKERETLLKPSDAPALSTGGCAFPA